MIAKRWLGVKVRRLKVGGQAKEGWRGCKRFVERNESEIFGEGRVWGWWGGLCEIFHKFGLPIVMGLG